MYIVIELQTNTEGVVGNIVYAYNTRLEAESKYHEILSYAARSSLPTHAAVILTGMGQMIASEYYVHDGDIAQ